MKAAATGKVVAGGRRAQRAISLRQVRVDRGGDQSDDERNVGCVAEVDVDPVAPRLDWIHSRVLDEFRLEVSNDRPREPQSDVVTTCEFDNEASIDEEGSLGVIENAFAFEKALHFRQRVAEALLEGPTHACLPRQYDSLGEHLEGVAVRVADTEAGEPRLLVDLKVHVGAGLEHFTV